MRTIIDVIEETLVHNPERAKEKFCEKLKRYLHNKYKGISEHADFHKFTDAYLKYLSELKMLQDPSFALTKSETNGLVDNNVKNWLDPTKGISRESIIDIAFILADSQKKDGEDIANDLLKSMHYPQLHASSELEIFYIYAFRNGLKYVECLKLYKSYLERDGIEFKDAEDLTVDATSTVFHNELINIKDEERLFSFVDSKRRHFGIASQKMNRYFSKTYYEMLENSYKIVIKSYENTKSKEQAEKRNADNADIIADVIIHNSTVQESEKERIIAGLKNTQKQVEREPLTLYIFGQKNADAICECISSYGGKAQMRKINQMEQKLDFYLFYAGDESLSQFFRRFLKTRPQDYMENIIVQIDCRRYSHYFNHTRQHFYPIRRQKHKSEKPIGSFTGIFTGIDSVLKNEKSFSREGMLLWFLYYFSKVKDKEKYYSLVDINDILSTRYLLLDEEDYFDKFIVMLLKLELKNGAVFYDQEEIAPDNLSTQNIHALRHSVIRLFEPYFNSSFAVDIFHDKDDATTSTIFKSTQKRLLIK